MLHFRILVALASLFSFIVLFSLLVFVLYIFPTRFKTEVTPSTYGLNYENVGFRSSDGLMLKGWLIPNEDRDSVIIVAHGYPFDKANILQATYFLADKYNLLLFDFRYFGESEGRYSTGGAKESKDMLAAVEFLKKERNFTKIGVMGFSMGGAAALTSKSSDLKAAVIDSTYASMDLILERVFPFFPGFSKLPFVWLIKFYGLLFFRINVDNASPLNSIKSVEFPILLIHGEKDSQIPVNNAYLLYENSNKDKTELWIVPNADHGMAFATNPEEYKKKVIQFFNKYMS